MQPAILATLIAVIGAIPLAHYLTAGRRDRQLHKLRARLRRNGWICAQRGAFGERWERQLTHDEVMACKPDAFLIPATIGLFTLERLEYELGEIEEEDRRG